ADRLHSRDRRPTSSPWNCERFLCAHCCECRHGSAPSSLPIRNCWSSRTDGSGRVPRDWMMPLSVLEAQGTEPRQLLRVADDKDPAHLALRNVKTQGGQKHTISIPQYPGLVGALGEAGADRSWRLLLNGDQETRHRLRAVHRTSNRPSSPVWRSLFSRVHYERHIFGQQRHQSM